MASMQTPLGMVLPIPERHQGFWARAYIDAIAWTMICQQLRAHTLPWRVEQYRFFTVYASDDHVIAEWIGEQEAVDIVHIAEMIVEQLESHAA